MARFSTLAVLLLACTAALVLQPTASTPARMLLQTSTSGSCPSIIPGCMPKRCSLKTVDGKQQSMCERCKAPYVQSMGGLNCVCPAGYYEACNSDTDCDCKPCETGFYCLGGKIDAKNSAPHQQRGLRKSCIKGDVVESGNTTVTTAWIQARGLTTKANRTRRHSDCVPMPGFKLAATTAATQAAALCGPLTYSAGYGRIRECFKCQSGTQENTDPGAPKFPPTIDELLSPTGGVTYRMRSDRYIVCQIPPGMYLAQNVVRVCPSGTFRDSFRMATEEAAKICFTCPPGLTTDKSKGVATKASDCTVIQAGVNFNSTDLAAAQAAAQDVAGGLSNGTSDSSTVGTTSNLCPYGTYFGGGELDAGQTQTCKTCPDGTTTQNMGSTSVDDCMVPPGYYIKSTTKTMEKCTNVGTKGYYRSNWASYKDVTVRDVTNGDGSSVCTPCGEGILVEPRDIDERDGGDNATQLVAATSWSCYTRAGWGITVTGIADASNVMTFKADVCAIGSYGVNTTTYGLISAPCKPCQRNLVTLTPAATGFDQCVNPAGYGYDNAGATPCPEGYYAEAGSKLPCTKCPPGRTTLADPDYQASITDCFVMPGYGVYDPTANDPWSPATGSNMDSATLAAYSAVACPAGYYSAGSTLGATCTKCEAGTTTVREGATNSTECEICIPGYGKFNNGATSGTCSKCPVGTYQAGFIGTDKTNNGDGATCLACPQTNFIYISSRAKETSYNSTGFTYRQGATGREECVPTISQFGIDIGQKILDDSLYTTDTTPDTLGACVRSCAPNTCCFVTMDYFGDVNSKVKNCRRAELTPSAGADDWKTINLVYHKMIISDALAAASVNTNAGDAIKVKSMSSGLYARCQFGQSWTLTKVGTDLKDAATGQAIGPISIASAADIDTLCKTKCDMMSTCWGFTVTAGGSGRVCTLRGGEDLMDARSFFSNPANVATLNWVN